MEDDFILKPNAWHEIESFLNSDCQDNQWDRVLVDVFEFYDGWQQWGHNSTCQDQNNPAKKHMVNDAHGFGAHLQIFRTSSLRKYLERNSVHIMDHADSDPKDTIVRYWNPDIVLQSSMAFRKGYAKMIPKFCSRKVAGSNIQAAHLPEKSGLGAFKC
eukprot:gnl/MRDRNA2_/MRDRNA2_104217_c0_seq1.p1 gnl/MRDRNA2_/MRDRNA2_104217_c0~~gnl/MRDRNA2_/MRDRNA2_104217_c0_seq1.p1  ORF type:complete len:158 (-),score=19.57 gnl/MRDRNA2_/MRDRNA2_104217_c0_seq1:39-512(-)